MRIYIYIYIYKYYELITQGDGDAASLSSSSLHGISWGGTGTTEAATRRRLVLTPIAKQPSSPTFDLPSELSLPDGLTTIASLGPVNITQTPRKPKKTWVPKPDFETHVLGGFARPYKCNYPGILHSICHVYCILLI